jgi:hypothetical protein
MRKTAVLPLAFLSVVAIALAAGCANGNLATAGGAPSPAPTPSSSCAPSLTSNIQLVFPVPGTIGAANLQGIVVAVSPSPLPTNYFFYASQNNVSTYPESISPLATPAPPTASSSPSPLPTPSATPLFANPIYESGSIGIFATSTVWTIYIANSSCYPGVAIGSFTTANVDTPTPTPSPSPT